MDKHSLGKLFMILLKPQQIQVDDEVTDKDFFSLAFHFDSQEGAPDYLLLCRDYYENPEMLYIEVQDQSFGFNSCRCYYFVENYILTISLCDEHRFACLDSSTLAIELSAQQLAQISHCLERLFNFN